MIETVKSTYVWFKKNYDFYTLKYFGISFGVYMQISLKKSCRFQFQMENAQNFHIAKIEYALNPLIHLMTVY